MKQMYFSDRSVSYSQFLDDVSKKVALLVSKQLKKEAKKDPELVSTEEAARILNITPDRLRHTKEKYPHVKQGENKQGKLLFVRDALVQSYLQ